MEIKGIVKVTILMILGLLSATVNSATISRSFSGNDCSGYFGTGFDSCTIFVNDAGVDIELSPVIAKFNGNDLSLSETNGTVLTGGVCDVADAYVLSCLDAAQVVSSADWTTPDNKGLSHLTFYDTAIVPVPAAVWLFGSGLLGLVAVSRRKA